MSLSFSLAHTRRGERDDDGISLKEVMNSNSAKLHVVSLFIFRVNMAIGLMNLKEILND